MPAILTALALASAFGGADTAADTPDRTQRLEEVQVTATRRPEATLEVPVATTVVGGERLRRLGAPTAMEALHGETGTFVQQTTPGQAVVIVRGLKGSEVLHLVDGFRLNNAIFRNAPNQYMALVDGQLLDRIEVVRGPMSTLYGGDAMGGVVQMLTPEPRFAGDAWRARGSLRSVLSTADHGSLTRLDGAGGRAGLSVSGGFSYQDVGERRTGDGRRQPFTGFTMHAADVKLLADIGEADELMLSAQMLEQPWTPRHDELVPGFGQEQAGSATFLFEPQSREFLHARWRIGRPTALWDGAELHLGRQRIDDDRRTRDTGSPNEDRERNRDVTLGLSWQAGKQLGEDHHLTWGAEFYRDEVHAARVRRNLVDGTQVTRAPRFPDGSTLRQFGLFVADDWWVTPRIDFNYGLRWSRVVTTLPATGGAPGVRIDNDDLSGNAGIAFGLRDDLRLVANAGRGFRAPNVFDLGVFGDRPGNRFSVPNPDLEPETVTTVDLGLKYGGERGSAELIAFRSRYRDKITAVLTGEVTDGGRLVVQNRNATRLALWGLEAGLRRDLGATVSAYATATWTRGDERLDGEEYPADRIPPLFGKLGVAWSPRRDLALEAYAVYADGQDRLSPRDAVDPRIDPDGTAGWVTLNASLRWQVSDDLAVGLRLENVGDAQYREHGSGLDEPGRNAMVSFDWRF